MLLQTITCLAPTLDIKPAAMIQKKVETSFSVSMELRINLARRYDIYVLFSDHWSAHGFAKNTNVIELYNLILKGANHNQRTWYNSGIGTYARPSWKSAKYYRKVIYHKVDLAIAWCVMCPHTKLAVLILILTGSGTLKKQYWQLIDGYLTPMNLVTVYSFLVSHLNCSSMPFYSEMSRFFSRRISSPSPFSND